MSNYENERLRAVEPILTACAQILDVIKGEWSQTGDWTEWDQSVRDSITAWLRENHQAKTGEALLPLSQMKGRAMSIDPLTALRELLADVDDVEAGKLPQISAATLARARQAADWHPIDSAPKEGLILVCWAGSTMYPVISRWLKNAQAWTTPFNKPTNPPTHWMPLPAPATQ